MKAYEFQSYLSPDGTLKIPEPIRHRLSSQRAFRVLILIDEDHDAYLSHPSHAQVWPDQADPFLDGYPQPDIPYDGI